MRKKTLQSILWHFCDQVLKKNLKLTSKISLIMQKKSFQIFQKEFFSNSTSFLLKKSYIPSNIAPFNYPGTLRVIGPGSGPGPGNGKSQKTGSGPGTPLLGKSGYPGYSIPVATLLVLKQVRPKYDFSQLEWSILADNSDPVFSSLVSYLSFSYEKRTS